MGNYKMSTDTQVQQLQNYLSGNVSKVPTLTAQITKLNDTIAEQNLIISQKNIEIEQLDNQTKVKNEQLTLAWARIAGLRVQMEDLMKQIELLKNPPQTPNLIK